jgi:iron complex outermembrane recepter protein
MLGWQPTKKLGKIFRIGACAWFFLSSPAHGQSQSQPTDLTRVSIEDLMNVQVTSVSKKEQKLSRTAAAIFIIMQEDIRRSGARNVPDLLRMVPGVNVAQINANTWAISARGFNSQFSNKLLVLIDGRTIYTPVFSGVYWHSEDVLLEDVERIEIIRGPGATVWGANAVNGVINIITKKASETQGVLLEAGAGNIEHGLNSARYGGKLGNNATYRIFSQYSNETHLPSPSGQSGADASDLLHGGFRVEGSLTAHDAVTLQGDIYAGNEGGNVSLVSLTPPLNPSVNFDTKIGGGNVLTRWDHELSSRSETSLRAYFSRYSRGSFFLHTGEDVFDIDFQHHVAWGSRQDIVWGVGYRYWSDDSSGSLKVIFTPAVKASELFSSFIQDEISLLKERVYLTLGTKLEHNDYTGFEVQPSARITWKAGEHHMFWGGYSRSRRTPSLGERNVRIALQTLPGPGGVPVLATVQGSPNTISETLDAFEAGYRTELRRHVSLDLAAFYNRYDHLQNFDPGIPFLEFVPLPPHLVAPAIFANKMQGETHGLEMAVKWKVTGRWTISPGYSFERIHLRTTAGSQDAQSVANTEGSSPHHQAQMRSTVSLPRGLEWNTSLYFVDRLITPRVPSYTRIDTGLTWNLGERWSLAVVGQNLVKDHRLEFISAGASWNSSLIKRSAYAMFTWRF